MQKSFYVWNLAVERRRDVEVDQRVLRSSKQGDARQDQRVALEREPHRRTPGSKALNFRLEKTLGWRIRVESNSCEPQQDRSVYSQNVLTRSGHATRYFVKQE